MYVQLRLFGYDHIIDLSSTCANNAFLCDKCA